MPARKNTAPTPPSKILISDVRVGDRIAKTRAGEYREVTGVEPHPKMIRLTFADGETAQPAGSTSWWTAGPAPAPADGPVPGARYRVTYRLDGQRKDRELVGAYLGPNTLNGGQDFDLRPDAGTTTLPAESIRGIEALDAPAPAKVAAAAIAPAAKTAASLDAALERVTFKDAAEQVLRAGDGPLKVKAIAELAIPLVRPVPAGLTPAATLGAHLITDANKGGRFVKTAPGTFDVREINPRGAAKRPAPRSTLAMVPDAAA